MRGRWPNDIRLVMRWWSAYSDSRRCRQRQTCSKDSRFQVHRVHHSQSMRGIRGRRVLKCLECRHEVSLVIAGTEHGSCLSTRALVHAMLPADPTHLEDSSAPALGFSDVSRLPKPGCKKLMLACFLAGQLSHEHSSVQCHPLSAAS